ncbi:hypothetical protein L873DRAFT_1812615 [Choiromyces venosus 120613-1]|uniref:Uncharacterized protein n=1 Tax=Choiromyces venosus 120613-1 TaxID=1336337 RepID=A0A3N4JBI8_9PEZI|nr:hypothetical protein L873DRAFT_1812615 [Choiromyces venosus 120613-1]
MTSNLQGIATQAKTQRVKQINSSTKNAISLTSINLTTSLVELSIINKFDCSAKGCTLSFSHKKSQSGSLTAHIDWMTKVKCDDKHRIA